MKKHFTVDLRSVRVSVPSDELMSAISDHEFENEMENRGFQFETISRRWEDDLDDFDIQLMLSKLEGYPVGSPEYFLRDKLLNLEVG